MVANSTRASAPSRNPRVLIVDDEPSVPAVLADILGRRRYRIETVTDAAVALDIVRRGGIDVVLADLHMPRIPGMDLLRRAKQIDETIGFVILTGSGTLADALEALRQKADDYLLKPFNPEEVRIAVERVLQGRVLAQENRRFREDVRRLMDDAHRLHRMLSDVVAAMARAAEARDGSSGMDVEQVARWAVCVGRRMGLEEEALRCLWVGGLLHDVGNLALPEDLLAKPGRLTPQEYEIVKRHPVLGASFVERSEFLRVATPGILYHHERWDGTGYPYGLAGERIPLEARILAVVDSLHALTNRRPYRPGRPLAEALVELRRCAGTQFDQAVVSALDEVMLDGDPDAHDPMLAPLPPQPVGSAPA